MKQSGQQLTCCTGLKMLHVSREWPQRSRICLQVRCVTAAESKLGVHQAPRLEGDWAVSGAAPALVLILEPPGYLEHRVVLLSPRCP